MTQMPDRQSPEDAMFAHTRLHDSHHAVATVATVAGAWVAAPYLLAAAMWFALL